MAKYSSKSDRKSLTSKYRNIIKFKNGTVFKYQVKFQHKNKIYGSDKIFTNEKKAVSYRNKLWKEHHPALYKEQFPSENEESSSSEEESSVSNLLSDVNFQMPERVPESAKRVIFTLQNNICPVCRQELKCNQGCHLDHIYPKQFGGPHEMKNFQMLHYNCHQMKTDVIDKDSHLVKILKNDQVHVIDKISAVKKMQSQIFT